MTQKDEVIKLDKREWLVLINAILVGLSCFLPFDLYLPSLPHIVASLHTTTDQVQLSITLFLLGLSITQIFFGPLSDRYGRRPNMIIGLCASIVGSVLIVFCLEPWQFLCGRFIEGMGAGIGMLLARTLALDLFTGKRLSIVGSYVTMVFSLSPIVAPALGGVLQTYYGWRSNFILMASWCVVTLIFFVCSCPETNQNKQIKSTKLKVVLGNYKMMITSPVFIGFMLGSGVALSINSAYAVIAPFLFQGVFHLSAKAFGYLSVVLGFGSLLGKFANSLIVKRFEIRGSIVISYAVILLAGLFLMGIFLMKVITISTVVVGIFIATFSIGFMTANAMAGALSPFRHMGGTTAALYGSLGMLVSFVSSGCIASLPWHNTLMFAVSYLCLGGLGLFGFYRLILSKDSQG